MDKDLEKEYLEDLDHYDEGMGIHSTSYEKCKERLIRLAKIDNAQPSEALECLKNFVENNEKGTYSIRDKKDLDTIKQALIKAQEQDQVLEIIKKKNVMAFLLKVCKSIDEYNFHTSEKDELTQEEFDLLKRYFK
jgi:replicative DNA helicase